MIYIRLMPKKPTALERAVREQYDADRARQLVVYRHEFASPTLAAQAKLIYDKYRPVPVGHKIANIVMGLFVTASSVATIIASTLPGRTAMILPAIAYAAVALIGYTFGTTWLDDRSSKSRGQKMIAAGLEELIAADEEFKQTDEKLLSVKHERLLTEEARLLAELSKTREKRGKLEVSLGLSPFRGKQL